LVNKFVFVIAGIVAAMAILIAIPNITQPAEEITIKYNKQNVTRNGETPVVTYAESLTIDRNGAATYTGYDPRTRILPQEQRFTLSSDDFGSIKGMMLETGFMDIPVTDYPPSSNAGEFTSYSLVITTAEGQKTFSWVNPEAHDGTIPPIILNTGDRLDQIIARQT
jgi:hypothetical protein